jgi:hypothetical protein
MGYVSRVTRMKALKVSRMFLLIAGVASCYILMVWALAGRDEVGERR